MRCLVRSTQVCWRRWAHSVSLETHTKLLFALRLQKFDGNQARNKGKLFVHSWMFVVRRRNKDFTLNYGLKMYHGWLSRRNQIFSSTTQSQWFEQCFVPAVGQNSSELQQSCAFALARTLLCPVTVVSRMKRRGRPRSTSLSWTLVKCAGVFSVDGSRLCSTAGRTITGCPVLSPYITVI